MARKSARVGNAKVQPAVQNAWEGNDGSPPQIQTAIKRKLPDLLTKQTTAYGSPYSDNIFRMPKRSRDFKTAIERALNSAEEKQLRQQQELEQQQEQEQPEPELEAGQSEASSVAISRNASEDPDSFLPDCESPELIDEATARSAASRRREGHPEEETPEPVSLSQDDTSRLLALDSARSFTAESRLFSDATILSASRNDMPTPLFRLPMTSLDRDPQRGGNVLEPSAPQLTENLDQRAKSGEKSPKKPSLRSQKLEPMAKISSQPATGSQASRNVIKTTRRPSISPVLNKALQDDHASARDADDALQRLLRTEMEAEQRSTGWRRWLPWRAWRGDFSSKLSYPKQPLGIIQNMDIASWLRQNRALLLAGILLPALALSIYALASRLDLTSSMPNRFFGGGPQTHQLQEQSMYEDLMKLYTSRSAELNEWATIDRESISKLKTLLPGIVSMSPDEKGRPTIPTGFWHALRDYVKQDGLIMTFDGEPGSYQINHNEHWIAIKNRLVSDPSLAVRSHPVNSSSSAAAHAGLEPALVQDAISRAWETWVAHNNDKISGLLGPMLNKLQQKQPSFDRSQDLAPLVEQAVKAEASSGRLVTRDEFMQILQRELKTHQEHVKSELQKPALAALIERSVKAATQAVPPAGMSRGEITSLVHKLVQSALVDTNLHGLASGEIYDHWQTSLRKRVNYFGWGNGARIDSVHTSPKFVARWPPLDGLVPRLATEQSASPEVVLKPFDSSRSFCGYAALDRKTHLPTGVSIYVMLSREVVPDHVVLEHIHSGATLDPGATPKDVEVWASYEEVSLRERVKDFSEEHFGPSGQSGQMRMQALPEPFVKIGQFRYESSESWQGRYVHRLSEELTELQAATDQVAIRAISNHGIAASNHTCFYGIQLYGQQLSP